MYIEVFLLHLNKFSKIFYRFELIFANIKDDIFRITFQGEIGKIVGHPPLTMYDTFFYGYKAEDFLLLKNNRKIPSAVYSFLGAWENIFNTHIIEIKYSQHSFSLFLPHSTRKRYFAVSSS